MILMQLKNIFFLPKADPNKKTLQKNILFCERLVSLESSNYAIILFKSKRSTCQETNKESLVSASS